MKSKVVFRERVKVRKVCVDLHIRTQVHVHLSTLVHTGLDAGISAWCVGLRQMDILRAHTYIIEMFRVRHNGAHGC